MKPPKIEGLLVPRGSRTGSGREYSALALIGCIGHPPTEVMYDHVWRIPTVGYHPRLTYRPNGLWASFTIDNATNTGRGAELAIAYGYIRRLSFGSEILATHWETGERGDVEVIDACDPIDISLTATPAAHGTCINIVGREIPWRRTLPTDAADRKILERFLARCGIDSAPDPVPATKAKSIVARSRPVPAMAMRTT